MANPFTHPVLALDSAGEVATQTAGAFTEAIKQSFYDAFYQVVQFAPSFVAALLAIVIGYILARVASKMVDALSERLGIQRAAERSGLTASMKQVGIQRTVPQILGLITFWLLMSVFVMAACNILKLPAVSVAMQEVVKYIPNLIVAIIVLVVGLLLASFLRGIVATSADRVGLSYASQLANTCYYVLALLTFIAAFEQLHIQFELLNQVILIVLAAAAVGFCLAFGLGGRDVMGGILAGYYVRQRLAAGDRVEVAGFTGTVREVGPVATVIDTEENGMKHRHTIPNTRMLNEAVR